MIDIAAYRARIGMWSARKMNINKGVSEDEDDKYKKLLLGIIIFVLLVIGNVELNPGPGSSDAKIDKLQAEFEKQSRVIAEGRNDVNELKTMFTTFMEKFETISSDIKNATDYCVSMKEEMDKFTTGTIERFKKLQERCKMLEDQQRRNNIVIFGVDEVRNERSIETLNIVTDILYNKLWVENIDWWIDSTIRIGKRSGRRPIVVRFTSFNKKMEVLSKCRHLAGTGIRIENDYSPEIRKTRSELRKYLIDAKKKGHKAFIKHDKIIVNGREFNLEYCRNNVPIEGKTLEREVKNANQSNQGPIPSNSNTNTAESYLPTRGEFQNAEAMKTKVTATTSTQPKTTATTADIQSSPEIAMSPAGSILQLDKRRLSVESRDIRTWFNAADDPPQTVVTRSRANLNITQGTKDCK